MLGTPASTWYVYTDKILTVKGFYVDSHVLEKKLQRLTINTDEKLPSNGGPTPASSAPHLHVHATRRYRYTCADVAPLWKAFQSYVTSSLEVVQLERIDSLQ